MAIAPREMAPPLLTYDHYVAEGEVFKRYDIVDGIRILMTNPTRRHQEILLNVAERLRAYQRESGRGRTLVAPQDVLITREPLRTRQPDVLFITHERLARNAPADDPAPLFTAPELVVEILSTNETGRGRSEKLADYCTVGVRECWAVYPREWTVEVLPLTPAGGELLQAAGAGEEIQSVAFPDLRVPVDAIFAP